MKKFLDECSLDETAFWMKVSVDENVFGCGAQSNPTRCSIQNFGDIVSRRDLQTSGKRDAVSAFHHEGCVQGAMRLHSRK